MRIALEPTFKEFRVDLVFTGCGLRSFRPLAVTTGCCKSTLARLAEGTGPSSRFCRDERPHRFVVVPMHGCESELAPIERVPSCLVFMRACYKSSGVCRVPELALWYQACVACGCRHVHAYERHNRVFNYTVDDCAPYHVTIGMPQGQGLGFKPRHAPRTEHGSRHTTVVLQSFPSLSSCNVRMPSTRPQTILPIFQ